MSWRKCILIGVVLGSILGLAAYTYLWIVGNQLEAQVHANKVNAVYEAYNEQKRLREPLDMREAFNNGELVVQYAGTGFEIGRSCNDTLSVK